jgi:hypothetical protein
MLHSILALASTQVGGVKVGLQLVFAAQGDDVDALAELSEALDQIGE